MGTVTVELDTDRFIAEQKLIRTAMAVSDHPGHSVARNELKAAVEELRAILTRAPQ